MDPDDSSELDEFARMVARCRDFTDRLEGWRKRAPSPDAARFLYRQFEQVLRGLEALAREQIDEISQARGADPEPAANGKKRKKSSEADLSKFADGHGLQGNSWTIPLADLMAFLAGGSRTGALWVHGASETFILQLRKGELVHATSDQSPPGQRLGEILVKQGTITEAELEAFLDRGRKKPLLRRAMARVLGRGRVSEEKANLERANLLLGAAMVEAQLIEQEELQAALAFQVRHLFDRLLHLERAVFRFQDGVESLADQGLRLNLMQYLLEGARLHDERKLGD